MQVAILCGGLGTRLGEVTKTIPKSLVSIGEKPILEIILDLLLNQGFKKFVFLTGHLGSLIQNHFGDGRRWGISIHYSSESTPLGTGGSLQNANDLLEQKFLLLYGDSYLKIDYRYFISDFESRPCWIDLAVFDDREHQTHIVPNVSWNPMTRMIISYSKNGGGGATHLDAGALIISKAIFQFFTRESFSLEKEIFPKVIEKGEMRGYEIQKRFYDIGSRKGLEIFRNFYDQDLQNR